MMKRDTQKDIGKGRKTGGRVDSQSDSEEIRKEDGRTDVKTERLAG